MTEKGSPRGRAVAMGDKPRATHIIRVDPEVYDLIREQYLLLKNSDPLVTMNDALKDMITPPW